MLKGLVDRWKTRELFKNPVMSVARDAALQFWVNNKDISGQFSPQSVRGQYEGMMSRAAEVAFSDNPPMKNREFLSGVVQETALYEVVVLSNPKTRDVNDYKRLPGVTGELWPHLLTFSKTNVILRELIQGQSPPITTKNDVHDICLIRYRMCWAHMSMHNILRLFLMDKHDDPDLDWYRPFYRAMLIWEENCLRQEAGLGLTVEPMDAIQYHALIEMVDQGVRYPNLHWEEQMGRSLP